MTDKLPIIPSIPNVEKHLAIAAWNGSSGFCIVNDKGIILAANSHICRLLNYTESEMIGMHFNDFTIHKDQNIDASEFAALIRGDKTFYYMNKTWSGKLNTPISGQQFAMHFSSGEVIFVVSQIIEGLSPEQIGAFAVMVRSLMEDWLMTQGIKMTKINVATETKKVWYKDPVVWMVAGGCASLWPVLSWVIQLIRRIMDVLYPTA